MMYPLNYPTGTEYSKKTRPLLPSVKELATLLEQKFIEFDKKGRYKDCSVSI